nr:MAG TPA: SITE SPECIFIC RECOMBINASE XERD [Caudoviricetes sp.]
MPYFTGPFAPMCETFVAQKRASGLIYKQQAMLLKMFDNFCKGYDIRDYTITKEIATAWCRKRPNEKDPTRRSRVGEMQRFAVFLGRQGHPSYLLPALPKNGEQHVPYIFSKDEMAVIFGHLDRLEPTNVSPYRHLVYPLLFRILYGCGLRISEALSLYRQNVDVDNGVLHIQHGKNDRERIVPMSATLASQCRRYIREVHQDTTEDMPFFYTKEKKPYSKSAIEKAFRGFLWDVGIPYRGTSLGPRVHDVRHTFVCHNIQKWAEGGIPISSKLPVLSKYLGHTSVSATQWYLRLTAETYPHIRQVCEAELGGMYADLLNFLPKEETTANDKTD